MARRLVDDGARIAVGIQYVARRAFRQKRRIESAGGTQELQDQTTGISGKMIDAVRDKLTEYLNPSFTLHDFVNDSTEGIENVQFVYKTDAIEIPDDDEEEAEPEDNRTFFEKLLALFGM